MSSPATAAFLAAWRSYSARPAALCLVSLTAPTSLSCRFGTTELHTPDGNTWEAGFACDPIRTRIAYLESGIILTDTAFSLVNRAYACLGAKPADSLKSYRWQGATVALYLWEQSLTSFSDALKVFEGTIDSIPSVTVSEVSYTVIQSRSWNKAIPTAKVDKVSYPNAPDVAQGVAIPIVTGDHRALPLRSPWAATYTNKSKQEDVGGGQGVVPLILVDPGLGAAGVKLVAAGHECADILDRTNGYSTFIVAGDRLAPIETASGVTETLGASESYLTIDDDKLFAYYGVVPTDVWAGATPNTGLNPRRAMDVADETSYATLNQTAGQNILNLILPNVGSQGRIDSVEVSLAFIGNAANTQNIRVYPRSSFPATGAVVSAVSTGTAPQVLTGTYDAGYYDGNWNFGGAGNDQLSLVVDFAGAVANNKASVIWAAIKVKYRPQQSFVSAGFISFNGLFPVIRIDKPSNNGAGLIVQPKFKLEGQFYANLKGAKDTAGGAYTGTASALIEKVPDTLQYYLQVWAGVSAASIETDATDFGSFVLGRSTMRNAQPSDFKIATHLGDLTNIAEVVRRICEQSLCCVVLDRFTGQWLFHAWKPGAAIDYDLTLRLDDLADMTTGIPSDVGLSQGVRVKYGYDHFKGRTAFEAFLSPTGSSQGYALPTQRDQVLTVSASNNKLDYVDGAGTSALTPGSATYTPSGLASTIRTLVRGIGTADALVFHSNFGFSIVTGFNDVIDFVIGASTYAATLSPFDYTAEGLAAEATAKMTAAAGATITVTYAHSTNKFSIAYAGTVNVKPVTGASALTSALQVLGWNLDTGIITSGAALLATYADRFHFCNQNAKTFNLKFLTGASTATNIAGLLGFPVADTGVVFNAVATYSRGQRESLAATSATNYGPKAEQVITADWIRDENSAVQLRDRIFDMNSTPRAFVKVRSLRTPDLQVMRVVGLDADIDAMVPFARYGSDGSNALKAMQVIEVEQSMGPSFHTEFLAIEAL